MRRAERPVRGTWLVGGFAVLVVGLVVASIGWLPALLVDRGQRQLPTTERQLSAEQRLKAESDARTSLLQAIVGLVLVVGAGTTWRQLHINREGQITERFGKAIDHLGQAGEDKLDVRLGGIYALERIAINSRTDRATIAEVLTAYVRGHAPWPPARPGQYRATAPIEQIPALQVRAADLQAILTVLGRRKHPPAGPLILDLAATDLRVADLRGADLKAANFEGANLQSATLTGAILPGATLKGTNLPGSKLDGANLQSADLDSAILEGAILSGANLQSANLWGANMPNANLARTNLPGANLEGANLQSANLWGANLQGAILSGANLQSANLRGANLQNAWATEETAWPAEFDWRQAGVRMEGEAATPE